MQIMHIAFFVKFAFLKIVVDMVCYDCSVTIFSHKITLQLSGIEVVVIYLSFLYDCSKKRDKRNALCRCANSG